MNPSDYVKLAVRTESDQLKALSRYNGASSELVLTPIRLNHAVLGMIGEVGELSSQIERWLHYGHPLNRVDMVEELGDLLWYVALACDVLQIDMSTVMEANIAKLRARYPGKFTTEDSAVRDLEKERRVVENILGSRLIGDDGLPLIDGDRSGV